MRCWSSRGSTARSCARRRRPNFWDANFVRVEGDASDLEPLTLVRAADALLAGSRHRKLEVQDEAAGARLRRVLRRRRLGRRPQRDDASAKARRRRTRTSRRSRCSRRGRCASSGTSATRTTRPPRRRSPTPRTASRCAAGCARSSCAAPAASRSASRRSPCGDDGVEIDQLYVTPDARGRGHRRRASSRPRSRRAGATTAWVIADDDGLARALYERLGLRDRLAAARVRRQPS